MEKVLGQAARLQKLVPDAILVGGTAVYVYAGHRYSLAEKWKDWDYIVELCKCVARKVMGNTNA